MWRVSTWSSGSPPRRWSLDAGLENLVTRHGSIVLEEGDTLAERLAGVRGQLDDQRRFTDANRGLVPAVRLLFDSLDSTLESAFRIGERGVDDAHASGDAARTDDPAARAERRAGGGEHAERCRDRSRRRTDAEHLTELEVAELTLRYANEAFLETLTDEQLAGVRAAGTGQHDVGRDGPARGPDRRRGSDDPDDVDTVRARPGQLSRSAGDVHRGASTCGARTDAMSDADAADLRVAIAIITLSVLGAALGDRPRRCS